MTQETGAHVFRACTITGLSRPQIICPSGVVMSENYVRANGIRLAYEEFGAPTDPVIVLMMGLGTQLIAWPVALIMKLTALRSTRL